jgi:hypothetical protein
VVPGSNEAVWENEGKMKKVITVIFEVETEASINDVHNAVNIGLNDSFPDNDITSDRVYADVYEK